MCVCVTSKRPYYINQISMSREEYRLLYEKYLKGLCDEKEKEALFNYEDGFYWPDDLEMPIFISDQEVKNNTYQQIIHTIGLAKKRKKPVLIKWVAAVIFLLISGVSFWWYTIRHQTNPTYELTHRLSAFPDSLDKQPILRLANGKTIPLNGEKKGILTTSSQIAIRKVAEGKIQYEVVSTASAKNPGNNTIIIPRGEQYQLVLPDGTKVWLNAASSLTFPEFFAGKERTVTLDGEAYFEVAKHTSMPFYVKAKGTTIEVLGTHFNVSAYSDDQQVKTSLMEGAVKLSNEKASTILKPGQQGIFSTNSAIRIETVNLGDVSAWMKGYFIFNDEPIANIMKQVNRWYDVDIQYEGDVQQVKYGGMISRYDDVRQFLRVLEMTSTIHYNMEGRHITLKK